MTTNPRQRPPDGVHAMVPRDVMTESARKLRDIYAIKPGAPILHREFGHYCLERWYEQGLERDADLADVFGYDPPGNYGLGGLGWCEAGFRPEFEAKIIEDRGEHEVVQDRSGRHVLCFKGRRSGFMPEYLDHPVKDMATWTELCEWRMDPNAEGRLEDADLAAREAIPHAAQGKMIFQRCVGGYMYLRSLIGPEKLLYAFYDMPEVVHACMETWAELADAVIAVHQRHVTLDEIFFGEDICYNHGPLISPDMMREFLFPYYRRVIDGARHRQIDPNRHLYVDIDTDGYSTPVIQVYRDEIGMDVMNPFEVAAGCDVVEIGQAYPWLSMSGGIDKRVLAKDKAAIDAMVERIIPSMRERGGYFPTCDHGVPEEVSLENYIHYRKRCLELGG